MHICLVSLSPYIRDTSVRVFDLIIAVNRVIACLRPPTPQCTLDLAGLSLHQVTVHVVVIAVVALPA